jgi:hypothetical protein
MKLNLLKRKLAAKQRALLHSGKRCSQKEILEESLEKLQEAWTNEGLEAAQGFLETSKELLTALEESHDDSVDIPSLKQALQDLEEAITQACAPEQALG